MTKRKIKIEVEYPDCFICGKHIDGGVPKGEMRLCTSCATNPKVTEVLHRATEAIEGLINEIDWSEEG